MDTNRFMLYNDFLYSLYTEEDEDTRNRDLLAYLRMLIPSSYASLITSDPDADELNFTGICCDPASFTAAEERYAKMYQEDQAQWNLRSKVSTVIRESDLFSDEIRLSSKIYQECYRPYRIYDTLQVSIVFQRKYYGVVTLFRTKDEPPFCDDDVSLLKVLVRHLNYVYSKAFARSQEQSRNPIDLKKIPDDVHLTPRETQILSLVFQTKSNAQICEDLHITDHTLQKHFQNIYRKLNISSRFELFQFSLSLSGTR